MFKTLNHWNPSQNHQYDKEKYPNDNFGYWLRNQLNVNNISIKQLSQYNLKESTLTDWYNFRTKKPRLNQIYKLTYALAKISQTKQETLIDSLNDALKLNLNKRFRKL
tara:strand:- start:3854 stop:4177 length:324 start_codon:yes stop_codon:yes gene_type:complete